LVQPSRAEQVALDRLLAAQQDETSPDYRPLAYPDPVRRSLRTEHGRCRRSCRVAPELRIQDQ
jgi:hypothetical protein